MSNTSQNIEDTHTLSQSHTGQAGFINEDPNVPQSDATPMTIPKVREKIAETIHDSEVVQVDQLHAEILKYVSFADETGINGPLNPQTPPQEVLAINPPSEESKVTTPERTETPTPVASPYPAPG